MKKLYFFLMAMLVSFCASAWTVSFTNPNNWANVYAYTFNPETNGGWPGKAMTKSGDVWTYTGTGTPKNIIFTNKSGAQTGDLDFVDGATYDLLGPIGAQVNEYTVYFNNSKSNWSKVYAYGWNGVVTPAWPGVELTQKTAEGLYIFTFESTAAAPANGSIIFNNNSGAQTQNFTWVEGATYDKDGIAGATMNDYEVFFDNSNSNWEKVYAYTFSPEYAGSWPGTELTANADGLYVLTISATETPTPEGIVFNDGTGANKTGNLVYEVGKTYSTTPVEIDYSQWYVNVLGDFNKWLDNGVNPVEGISKHENLAIGTTGFKIKIWNGAKDEWHFVEGSIATDEWVDFPENSFGGSATLIEGATEGSVYTVEFDCANNKVKVTKTGEETPEPVIPAAMYMSGDLGAGWEYNKEMTKAENVFTYDFVAGGQAHVTFTSGIMTEWVVADGVRYGAGDEDVAVELGTSYAMTASSDKCWSLPAGNYKATVTFDEEGVPTVVFTGETAEIFEIPEALFLSCDVEDGNWNFNNEMTNEGDGVFTAELVVPGNNAYITFATGNITVNEDLSWAVDGIRYGAGEHDVTIAMGESYTMEENNGNCWIIAGAGTYALTVTYDADAKTITLMAEKTSVPATDPVLYLRGADFGNWGIADETNQFTLEGGVYTLHVAALNGAFKITDADSNDENTITVADPEVRQDMVAGQTYTTANLYGSDADNMIMAEALTDVTVTYDRDNATIKVEGTVDENAVKTYTLMGHFYIYRGEINALAEAAWNEIAMTEDNGIYAATVVPTTAEGRMLIAGTRNGVALGYYKAADDAAALTAAAPASLAIDGTRDLDFNLDPTHKYEIKYNAESGELAAEDKGQTTGVEGIVAEDAEAPVYYNLQGVRVDNPAAGLYIVVRGSQVAKEMVK